MAHSIYETGNRPLAYACTTCGRAWRNRLTHDRWPCEPYQVHIRRRRPKDERDRVILALRAQGVPFHVIAERFGVTSARIQQLAKQAAKRADV